MTASRGPRRAPRRRPFSSWSSVGNLLVTLALWLPASTDACDEIPRYDSMKAKGNPVPPVSAGFAVEYECRPGYRLIVPLVRPTTTVCQLDGTWAPRLQEACKRKSCPQLAEPLNGRLEGNFQFGSQASYSCNEGYYLVGTPVLRCELAGDGNNVAWSGDPPQCEKILCQPPPQIGNGTFSNSHKDTFEYNEVVIYRCNPSNGPDEFSLVGESRLICSGPNKWSSDPPECKVVKCPYPSLPNGNIVSGLGKKYYYKAEVEFECNQGYSLQGSRKIICEANNTWVPEIPRCLKVSTPPSTKPPISSVTGHPPPDETPSQSLGKQKALLPTAHTRINQALQHSRLSDGLSRTLYHFIFFKMSRKTHIKFDGYYAKQHGGPSKLKPEPPCDLTGIYLSEGKSLWKRESSAPPCLLQHYLQ
ncbi:membrane cofactor protein isoform X6 [Myotis daubentonii]|uniref:membrane cofactor protein isoform X6 n=1 Tax=Myotis daubentonii TaxID=98922 RepID=UPI002873959B|nr:membrane cofactor protein isoform X6 [Myotis daubentonii]